MFSIPTDPFRYERRIRKPTITDKLICIFNLVRYAVTEPVKLRTARIRYEHLYNPPEENPLVSVYVPTYNRGEVLIERAVSTVLNQTYRHFEFIIVGDHCTDNTEELVSKIDDSRIRFYNLPERTYRYPETIENHWLAGPVIAANKALELVRGKWIARIDDDDTWTPDHIESLLRFAQEGQYELVSGQLIEERHGKRRLSAGLGLRDPYYTRRNVPVKGDNPKLGSTITWFYRSYLRFFRYNINCWRKTWNRNNDIDFSLRMFHAGVRLGFLEKVVAYVLPRSGEATIGLDAYMHEEEKKLAYYKFD